MPAYVAQSVARPRWTSLYERIDIQTKRELWSYMGFQPHKLQERIAADNHRHKVLCCGRRWGKSKFAASEALIVAALGGWVWVVGPNYDLAEIIFEDCAMMAESSEYRELLDGPPRMATGKQRLKTTTGGRIIAKSSEKPNSLLGRGLDLIIFDEASKEPNSIIWPQYLSPTLSDRLGASILISTPTGNDWFKDRWELGRAGEFKEPSIRSWQYESLTNPYFNRGEFEEQRRLLPERIFDQEYRAIFLDSAGGVFRGFSLIVEDCGEYLEVGETKIPMPKFTGSRYVIGVDLAKYSDWTVITVMDAYTRKMVYFERFNKIDWPVQRAAILRVQNAFRAPVLLDSTGIGDPILSEFDNTPHQYPIEGFKISAVSKPQLINQLAIGIEQQELRILPEPMLLSELGSYQYKRTAAGNLTMSAPEGKHDDFVISLALAWELCHRWGGNALPEVNMDPRFIDSDDDQDDY